MKKLSINKDISIAETMPSYFYLDDNYYKLSINKIFKKSWQFATLSNQFKNQNLFPIIFLENSVNEPLLLSSTKTNKIKCLLNVCTHRGSILCDQPSQSKSIQCPYHGRTFDLNGNLKNAPGFNNVQNFPKKSDNLNSFKVIELNNFIFVGIEPEIDISQVLDNIKLKLTNYPFSELIFDHLASKEYYIDSHWALYCENYLEGFHIPYIHKGLNEEININTYKTELIENGILQIAYSNRKNDAIDIDSNIYAYYYYLFPNLMINFYKWGVSINIIEPISKNKTKVRFLSYPFKNMSQPTNIYSSVDIVEQEDQKIVQNVQKGIESSFYNRGRYSKKYEKGVHHFHQLISRYVN